MATGEQIRWAEQALNRLQDRLTAVAAQARGANSYLPAWMGSLVSGWDAEKVTLLQLEKQATDLQRYEDATLPKLRSDTIAFSVVERDLLQYKRLIDSYAGDIDDWSPFKIIGNTVAKTADDVKKGALTGLAIGLPIIALAAVAIILIKVR